MGEREVKTLVEMLRMGFVSTETVVREIWYEIEEIENDRIENRYQILDL